MSQNCTMTLLELPDLSYRWECSNCETRFKDTRTFEKSRYCPTCGNQISSYIGIDEEENRDSV